MLEGGCLLGGKGTYSDVFYKEYCWYGESYK